MILIITSWLSIFLLMIIAWGIYLKTKNPGIIDVFWPIAITLSAMNFLSTNQFNITTICFSVLLLIWCMRLAGYLLFTRIIPQIEEKRYLTLSKKWKLPAALGFFLHYQFQGILAVIISTPFLWIRELKTFNMFSIAAITLIIIGIVGETIADWQLHQFKKTVQKTAQKTVCDIGLWHYSRHPNYFFELLIWFGFGASSILISNTALLGLISPILLLFIMSIITGPITEKQSILSRGEAFKHYQKTTSYIIPLPKKK